MRLFKYFVAAIRNQPHSYKLISPTFTKMSQLSNKSQSMLDLRVSQFLIATQRRLISAEPLVYRQLLRQKQRLEASSPPESALSDCKISAFAMSIASFPKSDWLLVTRDY